VVYPNLNHRQTNSNNNTHEIQGSGNSGQKRIA
jgi:hypothetical protein